MTKTQVIEALFNHWYEAHGIDAGDWPQWANVLQQFNGVEYLIRHEYDSCVQRCGGRLDDANPEDENHTYRDRLLDNLEDLIYTTFVFPITFGVEDEAQNYRDIAALLISYCEGSQAAASAN